MKRNYSTTRSEGVCNPRFDTRSKSYVGQDTHISLLKGDRQIPVSSADRTVQSRDLAIPQEQTKSRL